MTQEAVLDDELPTVAHWAGSFRTTGVAPWWSTTGIGLAWVIGSGELLSTGVKPMRMRTVRPELVLILVLPALRSRGLTNSSIAKLISESAVPRIAMARPAGTNHHQAERASACWPCAQNRIVPQFQVLLEVMPMKARVISESTAKMT